MASAALLEMSPSSGVLEDEEGLTHLAFSRLLEWLDDGIESHGHSYLEMRRRLTSYFDRRGRRCADDLADETLNRIGKTLEHDGAIAITPQARYCYVVARFVLLEDIRREQLDIRRRESRRSDPESWPERGAAASQAEELAAHEARLESLDNSLQALSPERRALIVDYYRDSGPQKIARRRELARRLGITMNALGIRVSRIRAALEARMVECGGER
jgi:DNA-directed RNA polymerase specialized sigma24 family protein